MVGSQINRSRLAFTTEAGVDRSFWLAASEDDQAALSFSNSFRKVYMHSEIGPLFTPPHVHTSSSSLWSSIVAETPISPEFPLPLPCSRWVLIPWLQLAFIGGRTVAAVDEVPIPSSTKSLFCQRLRGRPSSAMGSPLLPFNPRSVPKTPRIQKATFCVPMNAETFAADNRWVGDNLKNCAAFHRDDEMPEYIYGWYLGLCGTCVL